MKKVYLNTIIGLAEGLTQTEFTDYLLDQAIDIDGLEYRYEMFSKDTWQRKVEFLEFLETGKRKNWDLLLSIPDSLFTAAGLTEKFEFYLKEACQLGAKRIKMNIGQLEGISRVSVADFKELLARYQIAVNIENDQTEENGRFEVVSEALKQIHQAGLPVSYTFDAGNYAVMKEDAIQAFAALKNDTSIYHVKNVDTDLQTSLLTEGTMDWKAFLELDVPYVLEYPMPMSSIESELIIFKEAFY